jgi:hypothetical protein
MELIHETPRAIPSKWVWPWIISRRQDLIWLIGGALGAWILMGLLFGLDLDLVGVWFVWVIFIDTPHFFGTYARTLLDREERRRWGKLLRWSCGLLALGPGISRAKARLWRSVWPPRQNVAKIGRSYVLLSDVATR